MTYSENDIARELAAQIDKTDLGVTGTHDTSFPNQAVVRLDNGQEFLLSVTRWGGPRA